MTAKCNSCSLLLLGEYVTWEEVDAAARAAGWLVHKATHTCLSCLALRKAAA